MVIYPDMVCGVMSIDEIKEKYTFIQQVVVGGDDPDATDPHTVWFKVEQQTFGLDGYSNNREDAEWLRTMLATALFKLVQESVSARN